MITIQSTTGFTANLHYKRLTLIDNLVRADSCRFEKTIMYGVLTSDDRL